MDSCPPYAVLEQVLLDGLSAQESSTVRRHIAECADCQAVLDRLSDDPEVGEWPPDGDSPAASGEARLKQLVQELCQRPPGAEGLEVERRLAETASLLAPPLREGDLGALGPYRIQAELGRGGMGIVYKGYDDSLERAVAIKVLRPELAGPDARARLEREARASARFKHDHVVNVYAVASTAQGLPYLVMEYVAGPTLAARLRSPLSPRATAEVIAQAADGLAAAHAAGLIHRDIKPSNIIIDPETGRAKLLDFGLVRATERPSGVTQEGLLAGTPTYMSPEQARGQPTASPLTDVYSLGVTLYESLTGEQPFRGKPHLVLQQILHEEPRPPRRLNDAISRDLETICLKAMAKEPGRRYPSARALADDLRRWLKGEPIHARPVGRPERVWRWVRRNPLVATLATGLTLALFGGFDGVVWQWQRAEANLAIARLEHENAEARFRDALDAVDQFHTAVSENRLLLEPGMQSLRKELLLSARQYYERFARARRDDPKVQAELGRALWRLANITWTIGTRAETLSFMEQCLEVRQRLAGANPDDAAVQAELARTFNGVASVEMDMGRTEPALGAYERSLDICRQIMTAHPDLPIGYRGACRSYNNIGLWHASLPHVAAAEQNYRQGLEIGQTLADRDPDNADYQWNLLNLRENLAALYLLNGRPAEAEKQYQQAEEHVQRLLREHPRVADYRAFDFLCTLAVQSSRALAAQAGPPAGFAAKVAEVVALFRSRLGDFRQLAKAEPMMTEVQRIFAAKLTWLGLLEQALGRSKEAETTYREALGISSELSRKDPERLATAVAPMLPSVYLASLLSDTGRFQEALDCYQSAEQLHTRLPVRHG